MVLAAAQPIAGPSGRALWTVSLTAPTVSAASSAAAFAGDDARTKAAEELPAAIDGRGSPVTVNPGSLVRGGLAPIDASATAVFVWVVVALALLLWSGACYLFIARMRRRSKAVSGAPLEHLTELCRGAGVQPPLLLASSEARTPFLTGPFRPALMIPTGCLDGWDTARLRAVLAHEVGHLLRKDCRWGLVARAFCCIAWFQPLLWLLCRHLEEAGEEACDQRALLSGCGVADYARCLVDLAEEMRSPRMVRIAGTGVAPFRTSLSRRVRGVLQGSGRSLSRRMRLVVAATSFSMAVACLFVVSGTPAPARGEVVPPAAKPVLTGGTLAGKVLADGDMPAAGVELTLRMVRRQEAERDDPSLLVYGSATTNEKGEFLVTGLAPGTYRIFVHDPAARYASAPVEVAAQTGAVPPNVEIRLSIGARIDLMLTDTATGRPLAGVRVFSQGPHRPAGSYPPHFAETGRDGRVSWRVLPGENRVWVNNALDPAPDGGSLEPSVAAHRVEFAIQQGETRKLDLKLDGKRYGAATLAGRVLFEDGKPAAGVRVGAQCQDSQTSGAGGNEWSETRTNAAGEYQLTGLGELRYNVCVDDPSGKWIAAAAEGFQAKLNERQKLPDLVLTAGGIVEGQVVDNDSGKPLAGVSVGSYGPHRPRSGAWIISDRTDANGKYRLRVAAGLSHIYVADGKYRGEPIDLPVKTGETATYFIRVMRRPPEEP